MIYIGADHNGFELKEEIKKYLEEKDIEYNDEGTNSKEIVHYPQIASKVCKKMNKDTDKAILICGSGIGMSMVANKYKGIRAGVCFSEETALDGKQHSDLNVLALAGKHTTPEEAKKIIKIWLDKEFLNGRYKERLEMIKEIEKENMK